MGVDLYSLNPVSELGLRFSANWAGWRYLYEFCNHLDQEVTKKVFISWSNDGEKILAEDAKALGEKVLDWLNSIIPTLTVCPFCRGAGDSDKEHNNIKTIPRINIEESTNEASIIERS